VEDDMASVRAIAPKIRALEVPAELRLIPGWLIWRFEQYPGEAKARKVPYWTDGTIRHGQQGSPTDRARLTPFAAARDAAARMGYAGVGFAPLPDFGYTFLDFDNCVGPSGEIAPEIEQIVARTYAEFSPSGKGIRAALKGNLGNHKSPSTPEQFGFETFSTSMFVTFTGNILPACEMIGLENTVAEVDQHVIDLCERRFNGPLLNNVTDPDDFMAGREPRLGLTPERMHELVYSLDPNMSRADWIRVGMALHHECDGDDTGFELWDEWSQDGYTYVSTEAMRVQWDSFDRRKGSTRRQVTMASVIKMAKDAQSRPTEAASREEVLAKAEAIMAELPTKSLGRFGPVPIYDLTQREPMGWLIKGVLPRAKLGILFGASGSGKTFVALDLAFSVARGIAWRTRRTMRARVVVIAAEGGSGLGKRGQAYAQHHGFDLRTVHDLHIITAAPNFLDGDDISEVIAEIKNLGPVDLIIIDTLAQVTPGANENTSEDMGRALGNINLLHDATGAMNLAVHHAGKDLSKGSRGWSGIKAAADVQIEVLRHEDGRREIVIEKMKDGEDGVRWGFKLETILLGLDDDGDDITSCVAVEDDVRPAVTDDRKGVKRRGRLETHLLEVATLFPADAVIRAEDLIRKACDTLPPPEPGKRDIRRQSVVRAIQNLSREKDGPLRMENGIVIFYE
jgi:RecA/RadA recombinase